MFDSTAKYASLVAIDEDQLVKLMEEENRGRREARRREDPNHAEYRIHPGQQARGNYVLDMAIRRPNFDQNINWD